MLSDWKSSGKDEWHKYTEKGKSPKEVLGKDFEGREKFFDGIHIGKTVNGDWTFGSYYRQTPAEYQYKQGRLKTHAQAVRLAKKYMRTH